MFTVGLSDIAGVVRDLVIFVGSLSSNICAYVPNHNYIVLKSRKGFLITMGSVLVFLEM